jgi:hypothetical protein
VGVFVLDMSAGQKEADIPIGRSMLRVVVRNRRDLEGQNRVSPAEPEMAFAAAPLVGDLWMLCVADQTRTTTLLRSRDLVKLGLSLDEAIALGIKNLSAILPPLSEHWHAVPPGELGVIEGEGYYASSRILLRDDWVALNKAMGGHLIVAVPAADLIFYASDQGPDAIAALADTTAHYMRTRQRPVSRTLLRWKGVGWEVVDEGDDPP